MDRALGRGLAVAAGIASLALAASACRGGTGAGLGGTDTGDRAGRIKTDVGVTSEPCPESANDERGCIYLGTISDLTEGPFAAAGKVITETQRAFWARVNRDGGIGGYDVDVTSYVRDNKYNPQVHNQLYQEIKGKVLALAQSFGSPTTAAIIAQLEADRMVSAPVGWTSHWAFRDVVAEVGINTCLEAMNSVDYAVAKKEVTSVMALHYDGDYGDDAAAGTKVAAEANKLAFTDAETTAGQANQAEAIERVLSVKPDLVIVATNPTDMAVIVGQTVSRGFKGQFIGSAGTWTQGVMDSPAAPAIKAQFLQPTAHRPFEADTPGHQAMRAALGSAEPNSAHPPAWAWSYPLKAAMERALERRDLTRGGLLAALTSLETVDFQGMLPPGSGNYAGGPQGVPRQGVMNRPDESAPTGMSLLEDSYLGPTAQAYEFKAPCFEAGK